MALAERDTTGGVPDAKTTVWWPVAILTLVNVFNYIDRMLLASFLPTVQKELSLNDMEGGIVVSAFIVIYMVASPVFGWLGDRGVRKRWIALGVGLWSLATGLAGFAKSFGTLLAARATVGIGEAA